MFQKLQQQLAQTLIKDRHKFTRQLHDLKRQNVPFDNQAWLLLAEKMAHSAAQVTLNQQAIPPIHYPENLPVAQRQAELVELIKNHQVVVIAGETGSGKTTQIPKMCLEAGRGVFGRIGCTQPRRLAARSVAERLAEELGSTLGELVGYQVRFHDQVHAQSVIKVMTDGILLAEVQNDRFLSQYDTIIIDEAHERSINIDFLLGILKTLLPKRPDLKLVITSATIDTQRFADFFAGAPVVEVSGRTYPVEVRYRPLTEFEDDEGNVFEQDLPTAILHSLAELAQTDPFGDVLVFQVGERDIKETAEVLRKANLKNTEILPLYARLSVAEQNKIFVTSAKRRVILTTNVAETSLTVPGIQYVIDPGQARISRYSVRSKVQRLPVEKISQASANQRKGRCGRVSNGICIRLYAEDDFNARAPFTSPEIHRTSLATIILQMTQMKLGNVKSFPFIEPPEDKAINDGFRQLHEIGALTENRTLTETGRQLAKLPLDPRIGKIVLAGQQNGVLAEVLVIAAAISIQDPRETNEAIRQAANKVHQKWQDPRSDFLFFLNLWHFYEHQKRHLSQNKLRKLCKTNHLNYVRMKEWHDLFWQLEVSLKRIGMKVEPFHLYEEVTLKNQPVEQLSDLHATAVHRSLLAGLLGNIATRDDDKGYLGARNTKLFIHPSSALFKQKPKWLLAGELVETTKLYARNNAVIDVQWIESLAKHLIKHSYADPHWQKKSGQVGAFESVTLYGLPIITRRPCNYGKVHPVDARKIFIQQALVNAEMNSKLPLYVHNLAMIEQVKSIEHKLRRPDYLVDFEVLYAFYDSKLPPQIYSQPAFEKWVKQLQQKQPEAYQALHLTESFLLKQGDADQALADYPDQVYLPNQLALQIDYQFEPGKQQDGMSFHIPLNALNYVQESQFEWLAPSFLKEKVVLYIKALPKNLRKQFVPVPHYADLVLQSISEQQVPQRGGLVAQLCWALNRLAANVNQRITEADFQAIELPPHLMPYYILDDEQGKPIAENADLNLLKTGYLHLVEQKIKRKQTQQVIEHWDFGDLETEQTMHSQGTQILVYPALQVKGEKIVRTHLGDAALAEQAHGMAVQQLLKRQLTDKYKYLQTKLPLQKACLCFAPYGTCANLTEQVIMRALNQLVSAPQAIRKQAEFEKAVENLRQNWIATAQNLAQQVSQILVAHQAVAKKVKGKVNPRWLGALSDIHAQLDNLISPNFVVNTPQQWLQQLPKYLQGIEVRLQKLEANPAKDAETLQQIQPILKRYQQLASDSHWTHRPEVTEIRWKIEEMRLSLFAQPLKTLQPISIKRLEKAFAELGA